MTNKQRIHIANYDDDLVSNIQKMLIKNIQIVDYEKLIKNKLFTLSKLINISFQSVNPLYLMIVHLVLLFPFISVIFVTPNIFPNAVEEILRVFLLTNLIVKFGISPSIITITILVSMFLMSVLIAVHLIFNSVYPILSKILSFLVKSTEYLIVPIINYSAYCYTIINRQNQTIASQAMNALTFIFINIAAFFMLFLLKFELRVLRKKNRVWNLDNDIHVYAFTYLIFKSYFISFNGTNIPICFVSLIVVYYLLRAKGGSINPLQHRIQRSTYYLVAATDLSALVSLLFKNEYLGIYVWSVAIGSIIFFILIQFYVQKKDLIYLPVCSSPPQVFYNFYYTFKEEFKVDDIYSNNKKNYQNLYALHKLHCKEGCKLHGDTNKDTQQGILQTVSTLIGQSKNSCLQNRLIYQLWNLQLGLKCQIQYLEDKQLNIKQQFILYSLNKLTKDSEATMKSTQSNKNVISKVFYDLIFEICSNYSLFYQQLARTHPKIDRIINIGIYIKDKVEKLKQVYAELLKSRLINFKMIELYLEFFSNFVNENVMDKESVSRLMKVQQHMHFQDIAQNYLPTITFYTDSGNVQNANSEAQKYLQSTRFELKYRNLSQILYPSVSVQQIKFVINNEQQHLTDEEPIYTFIKRTQRNITCAKIVLQQRYIKQKKLIVIQVIKQPFSSLKNMFLVDKNFTLQLMMNKLSKIKTGSFRSNPYLIQWEKIYQRYIFSQRDKLDKTKMLKIQTDEKNCLIIVKNLRCLSKNHMLLLAQIIVSNESKDRKQSILHNRASFQNKKVANKFEFHYFQDPEYKGKALIHGYHEVNKDTLNNMKTFQTIDKENLHRSYSLERVKYGQGIKTYRLFDNDLYNIDLQDRQGYFNTFQDHITQNKKKHANEQTSFEIYVFVGVVTLGLMLIGFSVGLILQFQTASQEVTESFTRYQNIQQFNVDFQRIQAILRDTQSGLTKLYPAFDPNNEIMQSYNRIQNLKNQSVFDNSQYMIYFQDLKMIGTLSQLVDVVLAHVTQVLYTNNIGIVKDILNACVGSVNELLTANKISILSQIRKIRNDISYLQNVLQLISIAIILVLYLIMVMYCVKSNYKAKDKLTDLMYISDGQARMLQENAQKMKYAVEMARKNFDVDTQNLLAVSDYKKRKNPKEAVLSKQIVYTIGVFTIIGIIVHLSCIFIFSQQFSSQIANFDTLKQQGIAIQSIYSRSSELATKAYHTGTIDQKMLDQIRDKLSYVQHQFSSFLFSQELSKFAVSLFIDNSCGYLKGLYNISKSECMNTSPGFTIVNPFEIGFALYIHRQNYYLGNNITENYAHTGIFSKHFAWIFTNMTKQISKQAAKSLVDVKQTVSLLNGLIIMIDCSYIIAFLIIYTYFKGQLARIKQILYFFTTKKKMKKEFNQQQAEVNQSDSQQSEDEKSAEQIILKKRRTTIEHKIQIKQG